jgi:adenylate cyclase
MCYRSYFLGEPEEALKEIKSAMGIDPFCPDILFEDEGVIYYSLESYNETIQSFKKLKAPTINSLLYSAAAICKIGSPENAAETLSKALLHSGISIEDFIQTKKF